MASSIWANAFIHVLWGQRINRVQISGAGIALRVHLALLIKKHQSAISLLDVFLGCRFTWFALAI